MKSIIIIVCICVILSSFVTWYIFYRPTVRIENVHFEETDGNVSIVFTVINEENRGRQVKYRYSLIEAKSGEEMARGNGTISLVANGENVVKNVPTITDAESYQTYLEHGGSPVIKIAILENNKIVGEYTGRAKLPSI